jgi:hypothetical protein
MATQLSWFDQHPLGQRGAQDRLIAEGERVLGESPEGELRWMKVTDWIERLVPRRIDTCDALLPDGAKAVLPIPKGNLVVHQTPPRTWNFQWIAKASPEPFGPGAEYREIRLALPYVIVLAVFDGAPGGLPRLSNSSECFFSTRPLDRAGFATELCYPALLNCSRFPLEAKDKPLSWICVQHLSPKAHMGAKTPSEALRRGLGALLQHLFESGFNLSSEHHELSSWFSETVAAGVDARIASVETWEQASAEDPLFVLDVPWLPTGHTLQSIVERIAQHRGGQDPRSRTASDLVRVVFEHGKGKDDE